MSNTVSLTFFFLVCSVISWSETLVAMTVMARCSAPTGYTRYHFDEHAKLETEGFIKDREMISELRLVRLEDGSYNVLRDTQDAKANGAVIHLMRHSRGGRISEATFLLKYPNIDIELFKFYSDMEGKSRYDLLHSKGGPTLTNMHKSSLLSGECAWLKLDTLN